MKTKTVLSDSFRQENKDILEPLNLTLIKEMREKAY
jgi:hypothetical protein